MILLPGIGTGEIVVESKDDVPPGEFIIYVAIFIRIYIAKI